MHPSRTHQRFAAVFHALATAALQSCSAAPTPGATPDGAVSDAVGADAGLDAGTSFGVVPPNAEPVCVGEGAFTLEGALSQLTANPAIDYLEMHRRQNVWPSSLPPPGWLPWRQVASYGARCANASDRSRCEAAVAAINGTEAALTQSAFGLTRAYPNYAQLVLLYTRGDEVGVVRSPEEFAARFGPTDTAAEAAFLASQREEVTITCRPGTLRDESGAWIVYGGSNWDCHGPLRTWSLRVNASGAVMPTQLWSRSPTGDCPVQGRRPAGLVPCEVAHDDETAAWLAVAARMEAASVVSFARLADELRALDAPMSLVDAALESREDEIRHAAMMRAWCARAGVPELPVEVADVPRRTREEIARENAVEGCVHETWAAMEALLQAKSLRGRREATVMARIADDEIRHAALAWDVAAWIEPTLDDDARARIEKARCDARERLAARLAEEPPSSLCEELGLPRAAVATAAFDAVFRALSSGEHLGQRSDRTT